jgi:hypothetical protein
MPRLWMLPLTFACAAALTLTHADAQTLQGPPPSDGATAAAKPTTVSGVTITASKPTHLSGVTVTAQPCTVGSPDGRPQIPVVADTFPHIDSTVRPGLIFLRVTFSQPMSRCAYELHIKEGVNHPIMLDAPVYMSHDGKSFLFAALVGAHTRNFMWIGKPVEPANFGSFKRSAPSPLGFRSRYGVSAQSFRLRFTASDGPMVKTVADALAGDPEMSKLVAQPGDFVRLRVPQRSDKVSLWRCQDCDVDLKAAYAQQAKLPDNAHPDQPAPDASAKDLQGSEPSAHP